MTGYTCLAVTENFCLHFSYPTHLPSSAMVAGLSSIAFATTQFSIWRCCTDQNITTVSSTSTRLRARVAYDGTKYQGWQLQATGLTIQGVLESALSKRFQRLIRVVGASRTDSGVHGRGQGVHLDVPNLPDLGQLEHSWNRMLPPDVRVHDLCIAPPNWHAIFSSRGKHYAYRLSTRQIPDPLCSLYRSHVRQRTFCITRLREAAARFQGTHDFASFVNVSAGPSPATTVRTIHSLQIVNETADGSHIRLDFYLDGALYKMVRNIVGCMLAVAVGDMSVSDLDRLFIESNRKNAPMAAPAHGLCLEYVFYDGWKNSPEVTSPGAAELSNVPQLIT